MKEQLIAQLKSLNLRPAQYRELIPIMIGRLEGEAKQLATAQESRKTSILEAETIRLKKLHDDYESAVAATREQTKQKLADIEARVADTIHDLISRRVTYEFHGSCMVEYNKATLAPSVGGTPPTQSTPEPDAPPPPPVAKARKVAESAKNN